jgi:hypothetical protein
VSVFTGSQASGLDLVTTLTHGVEQLKAWVDAANESGASQQYFAGFAELFIHIGSSIVTLLGLLGQLTTSALPGLKVVWAGMNFTLQTFADLLDYFSPLIPAIVVAFAAWRAATIALTAATWALNIAFRLTPLGWIVTGIAAVIAAVIMMYNKWDWFRNAVNGVWSWMKTAATDTATWIIGAFQGVIGWIKDAIGWITQAKADAEDFLGKFTGGNPGAPNVGGGGGGGIDLGSILGGVAKHALGLPFMAGGGLIPPGSGAVVGDAGPEIAWNNGAGGTSIHPLTGADASPAVNPINGVIHLRSTNIVQIDRREVGRAVADEIADAKARR